MSYGHHECNERVVQDRGRFLPHPPQQAQRHPHGDSRSRLRGRGRGPRFRLRSVRRRSLQRVGNARCVVPRGQDRLPPVGREGRAHQPQRRGALRPRRGRAHGLTSTPDRANGVDHIIAAPFAFAIAPLRVNSRIKGRGWVAKSKEPILFPAHPLENRARYPISKHTSLRYADSD
jgi:hypothetical protein